MTAVGSDDLASGKKITLVVNLEPVWAVEDCVPVRAKAQELGLCLLGEMSVLPRGFETAMDIDDLVHESQLVPLVKLWRQRGVDVLVVGPQVGRIQENAATWIVPTLFVASSLMLNNPTLVTIALGVVANYVTDFLKGTAGLAKVKASVVLEREDGTCKKVSYEGPVQGLRKMELLVKETFREDDNPGRV
jgi:hypothetical protein